MYGGVRSDSMSHLPIRQHPHPHLHLHLHLRRPPPPLLTLSCAAPDLTELALYYTDHALPQRYSPGIVVASILVSVFGCFSTLTLLGKRTGASNLRNHFWLLFAATTMASVAVWGMVRILSTAHISFLRNTCC